MKDFGWDPEEDLKEEDNGEKTEEPVPGRTDVSQEEGNDSKTEKAHGHDGEEKPRIVKGWESVTWP